MHSDATHYRLLLSLYLTLLCLLIAKSIWLSYRYLTNDYIYICPLMLPSKVVNATIEVQAAADAAAERLKSWLLHQRKVEEQKR